MISKLVLLFFFVLFVVLVFFINNRSMGSKAVNFLALGDSYTIGEGTALYENFPYQTVQLLRKAGLSIGAPEIIAKTGWTSEDLQKGIRNHVFQPSYDFVTLLIGVNDQYQAKEISDYAKSFEHLLVQAIGFAGNRADHVIVLSIPDWGLTPFAADKQPAEIAIAIAAFNKVNQELSKRYNARYINQCNSTGFAELAADELHPSAKEYGRWARLLADEFQKILT